MIKSFENYTRGESVTIGSGYLAATRWTKRYDDGQTASLFVADSRVTRAIVREAFEAMKAGYHVSVFKKTHSNLKWYK